MMITNITIGIPVWLDRIIIRPILVYRRWRYGYSYRRIPVGEGSFAIVDPADYYWLNRLHWSVKRNRDCMYAVSFHNEPGCRAKIITMHREIMKPRKGILIDHKNRKTLDNRRENLRKATQSQNMQNRGKTKTKTTSRFIGVHKEKRCGHWVACITHHGKKMSLGSYIQEIDAARAYDKAAKKYRKNFARLNIP
jgi:hypothetical protein